jgi:vacuolar-type H+-ATPase subunit H
MSIYRVIDKFEAYVREGTWLPLGQRVLSEKRLYEFIDKFRATLPEEVGRAKIIAVNKERMIREAQERAQQIVDEASETHSQLIDQQEVMRRARGAAEVILREAEEKAGRVRAGADAYAAQVLQDLEARLSGALGSVRKGQETLGAQPQIAIGAGVEERRAEPPVASASRSRRSAYDAQVEARVLESVDA